MRKFFTFFAVLFIAVAANAATRTIYCKVQQSWWIYGESGKAAVGIYTWNEGGTPKVAWPGERMTAVEGEDGVWSFDLDTATYKQCIFTRVSSEGNIADWGAKSGDLTIPTDDKDLFTITSETAVWGDPGVAGQWSKFEPTPTTPAKFYIAGSMTDWDDNKIPVYADSYTFENLAAGKYQLKAVGKDWYGMAKLTAVSKGLYPDQDGNVCFTLAEAGDVIVNFVEGDEITTFTVTGAFALPSVKLIGAGETFGDWKEADAVAFTADEGDLSASHTFTLAEGEYEFKIIREGEWLTLEGEDDEHKKTTYNLHREWPTASGLFRDSDGKKALKITADIDGDYKFTWTYATGELAITFPDFVLEDGYYLVGNFGDVPAWGVKDLNPTKKFKVNPGDDKEYLLENVTLLAEDSLKVASVKKDKIEWYAPNEANYVVDADHEGASKTVYFRPAGDGGEGWWYNCIFVEANSGTALDNTDAAAKATKVVRNGMLLIEKNGHVYNVLGTIVK